VIIISRISINLGNFNIYGW